MSSPVTCEGLILIRTLARAVDHQRRTLNPDSYTLNPKPSALNPQRSQLALEIVNRSSGLGGASALGGVPSLRNHGMS